MTRSQKMVAAFTEMSCQQRELFWMAMGLQQRETSTAKSSQQTELLWMAMGLQAEGNVDAMGSQQRET